MKKLEDALDKIWSNSIIDYKFDLIKNSICFNVSIQENNLDVKQKLEFLNVSTFYFVNNKTENRKDFIEYEKGDYLEICQIGIIDETKLTLENNRAKWIQQYNGKANIFIEIWDSILLIEADVIKINDLEFSVAKTA